MGAIRRKNGQSKHARQDVGKRLDALREDFDALQSDVRGLMGDIGLAAGDQVKATVSDGLQSAQQAVDQAETWASRNVNSARKMVKSQPLKACAIALGAGALVSGLLMRR